MTKKSILILSAILILIAIFALRDYRPSLSVSPTATLAPNPTATSVQVPTALPTLPPDANPVVISEVLGGIQGNNNYEFVELFNRSTLAVDLRGWSLWYRLPNSQE